MVSTCLRGRSLLGACSETTKTDKRWARYLLMHFTSQTVDFTTCYVVSSAVKATLRAILCPNVAWSGAGLHLECVGPSIIPLCKYLHKETSLLPFAKTRESSWGTLSMPYTVMGRERVRDKKTKAEEEVGRRKLGQRKDLGYRVERIKVQSHVREQKKTSEPPVMSWACVDSSHLSLTHTCRWY